MLVKARTTVPRLAEEPLPVVVCRSLTWVDDDDEVATADQNGIDESLLLPVAREGEWDEVVLVWIIGEVAAIVVTFQFHWVLSS